MPDFHLPPYERHLTGLSARTLGQQIPWSIKDYGLDDDALQDLCDGGEHCLGGIVDTGISQQHEDFQGAIIGGYGGRWKNYEDYNGHGSHASGTMAARNNAAGVRGVAPRMKLFVAKGLDKNGSGTNQDITSAILAAADARCRVLNCSFGSSAPDRGIRAALERFVDNGGLPVCAAGNEGRGTHSWPAEYNDLVLSIGAIDHLRKLANFSTTNNGVDFVAPGVNILSTYKDGKYATLSGTSMATPWVSGLIALVISYEIKHFGKQRTFGVDGFTNLLKVACDDLGRTGRDPETGYGVPIPSRPFKSQPSKPVEQSGFDWMGLLGALLKAVFEQLLRGK